MNASEALQKALEMHAATALQRAINIINLASRRYNDSPAAARALLAVAEQIKIFSLMYAPASKDHPFADEALGALKGMLAQTETNPNNSSNLEDLVKHLLERIDRQEVEIARLRADMQKRPEVYPAVQAPAPAKVAPPPPVVSRPIPAAVTPPVVQPRVPAPAPSPAPTFTPEEERLRAFVARPVPGLSARFSDIGRVDLAPRAKRSRGPTPTTIALMEKVAERCRSHPTETLTELVRNCSGKTPNDKLRDRVLTYLEERNLKPAPRTIIPPTQAALKARSHALEEENASLEEKILERARAFPNESLSQLLRGVDRPVEGTIRHKAKMILNAHNIYPPDGRQKWRNSQEKTWSNDQEKTKAQRIIDYFTQNPTHTPKKAAARLGMWDSMKYIYVVIAKHKLQTGTDQNLVVKLGDARPAPVAPVDMGKDDRRVAEPVAPAINPDHGLTFHELRVVEMLRTVDTRITITELSRQTGLAMGVLRFALQQLRYAKYPEVSKVLG